MIIMITIEQTFLLFKQNDCRSLGMGALAQTLLFGHRRQARGKKDAGRPSFWL
ncbi:hypothetical protein I656_03486 [Geobacillus sp. WSUCF1]|nr:hypothetical protein I656_03486 [Geobacillus sp. WSUCF1]